MAEFTTPGRTIRDWAITIRGYITGANRDTLRANLEALQDGEAHQYSDGLITINAIIPDGGLSFDDDNSRPTYYTFSLTLLQFNQSS